MSSFDSQCDESAVRAFALADETRPPSITEMRLTQDCIPVATPRGTGTGSINRRSDAIPTDFVYGSSRVGHEGGDGGQGGDGG